MALQKTETESAIWPLVIADHCSNWINLSWSEDYTWRAQSKESLLELIKQQEKLITETHQFELMAELNVRHLQIASAPMTKEMHDHCMDIYLRSPPVQTAQSDQGGLSSHLYTVLPLNAEVTNKRIKAAVVVLMASNQIAACCNQCLFNVVTSLPVNEEYL